MPSASQKGSHHDNEPDEEGENPIGMPEGPRLDDGISFISRFPLGASDDDDLDDHMQQHLPDAGDEEPCDDGAGFEFPPGEQSKNLPKIGDENRDCQEQASPGAFFAE